MKTMIALLAACAGLAHAGVIPSTPSTSLALGNASGAWQTIASGTSNQQAGIADIGTYLGNFGYADIRSNYQVSSIPDAGPNGGNMYLVTVRVGSIRKVGPFARFYDQTIIDFGATVSGATITGATVSFGMGSNGLLFDDFGAATSLIIDSSNSTGYTNYAMKINDGVPTDIHTNYSSELAAAVVNPDGSVGFSINYNVSQLFNMGTNVSEFFNGDLAAFPINGFANQFVVEVIPAPTTGLAFGLGIAAMRRRRR